MARIRTIKPEFFRSRSLARVSRDARLLFAGLWCEADDAGRGVADPRILKGAVFPLDDDITADRLDDMLVELMATKHIVCYGHGDDDEVYYEIINWSKHQSASYRRGGSKLPGPEAPMPPTDPHGPSCKEVQPAPVDVKNPEGEEGKGEEGKGIPPTSVHNSDSEPDVSRLAAIADSYGKQAAAIDRTKGKTIGNVESYAAAATARIARDPNLTRLASEYPTAGEELVAKWLHGIGLEQQAHHVPRASLRDIDAAPPPTDIIEWRKARA